MELGREYGPRLMDQTFIGVVIQVDKVRLPILWQGRGVNSISMVLAGDMAFPCRQIQSWNVVCSVAVLELDGPRPRGKGQELVTEADAKDGKLRSLHQFSEVVDGVLAVSRVTRAIGDEHTVKVVSNFVDWVVEREASDAGPSIDETAENVFLHTAIKHSDVGSRVGCTDVEWRFGANLSNEIDLLRIDECLVLVLVVFLPNGDSSQAGTLLSKLGDNGSGINTSDGGHAFPCTPLAQALHRGPMGISLCDVRNNHSHSLDIGALEIFQKAVLVPGIRRHTIVANKRLGEDQNLASI